MRSWVGLIFVLTAAMAVAATYIYGFIRGYVDGELVFSTNHDGGNEDLSRNGFDRGYLMGYHNVGFPETADFYLTDWCIGTSPESICVIVEGKMVHHQSASE
jgi:hypothetical protein